MRQDAGHDSVMETDKFPWLELGAFVFIECKRAGKT
jgi:hypothetical protein